MPFGYGVTETPFRDACLARPARVRQRGEQYRADRGCSTLTFQTSANLYLSLDKVSVTGCWTDISEPLPSPVEPGAFLIRFLRGQQDCVIWCLYLGPSGEEAFVVHSHVDYEYDARRTP
ncbi:hypothetical protein [Streptomyces sp. V1I1]|uniref:hypothetical protein n=1 Tax=Streptomyces sp. V1I1 TaxID=3042272 RepID=UPI002783170B|nr:hypothetical protein [Streptomyces sp. V1I1]MDQ0945736.1 hypothetical protein [Streptomyces sp. V1I1]